MTSSTEVKERSQLKASPTLVIAVLASAGASVSMMYSLITPLLGSLVHILDVSIDDASWTITATLLANAAATPTLSRLADMFGKRKLMLVSLVFMFVGSTLGALAPNLWVLILARTLQGCSTAVIPIGISVMRDALPSHRLGAAVALMSATMGLGGTIGIPVAGLLFGAFGWHAVFWVPAAIAAILLITIPLIMRETDVRTGGKFDYLGGVLFSAALLALLLAITKGGTWGWTSSTIIGLFAAFLILILMWIPWELRNRMPLIDIRSTIHTPVLLTNIASILLGFAFGGNTLGTLLVLTAPVSTGYGHGLSVTQAGLAMIPTAVVTLAIAPLAARSTGKFGARNTLIIGALVTFVGYVQRIFFGATVLEIIVSAIIISVGMAVAYAAMPTLIMTSVPITETSAANGLNSLLRGTGGAMSSAMFGALLAGITITVAGQVYPSYDAFQFGFVFSAVMAVLGAFVGIWINARPPRVVEVAMPSIKDPDAEQDYLLRPLGRTHDIVRRGIVVGSSGSLVGGALVTITDAKGDLVDWSRTESDGSFTIAIPEQGTYRTVVSEHGQQAVSTVADFADEHSVVRIEVPESDL